MTPMDTVLPKTMQGDRCNVDRVPFAQFDAACNLAFQAEAAIQGVLQP